MSPNAQALPSVDQVLQLDSTRQLLSAYSRDYVVGLVRQALQSERDEILSGGLRSAPFDGEMKLSSDAVDTRDQGWFDES